MTKDVLITISGIQTIDGEVNDPIETVTPGEYYFRNGKHYILYDEVQAVSYTHLTLPTN